MRSVKHGKRRGKTRSFWASKNKHNKSKRKKKAVQGFGDSDTIKGSWDGAKTPQQNLQLMGLSYDANNAIGKKYPSNASDVMEIDDHPGRVAAAKGKGKGKKGPAAPVVAEVLEEEVAGAEVSATARNKRKKEKKKEKMARRDMDFCLKMIERHGNDYEAMARDTDNVYQLTSIRLEHKIDRFKKSSLFRDDPELQERVPEEMQTK